MVHENNPKVVLASTLAAGIVAAASASHAGGLYVTEFGTPSMGTAGAGAQARAGDASTAFENPAGMTRLDDHELMMAIAPGYGTVKFDADADSPSGGGNGGEQGGLVPILSGSYVHKLSDRWRFGLSLLSISGASLDPNNDWAGRNQLSNITLFTLTIMPALAVRVTDWLSFGAGPAITYGTLDWDLFADTPVGERKVKIDDADDVAPAANISVLAEPHPDFRFGVVYQSETELQLDGDVKVPSQGLGPGLDLNINLELPLPQFVRWSFWWDATERLSLMAGGAWEDWSVFDTTPVSIEQVGADAKIGFDDTWKGNVGVEYEACDTWTLQTGFAYDTSAVNTRFRNAALPVDRQIRVGIGAIHDWSDTTQLGMSFTWVSLGDSSLNNNFVKGDYERNDLFLLGLNINWGALPWAGRATM